MVAQGVSWTVALIWFPREKCRNGYEESHFRKSWTRLYSSHSASAPHVSGLPCPNCGSELAFLSRYQRHYCYACGKYAPEGFGDRGAKRCPTCSGILSFVARYDRFYCYRCSAYPPEGGFMEPRTSTASDAGHSSRGAGSGAIVVVEPKNSRDSTSSTAAVGASSSTRLWAEEEIRPSAAEPQRQRRPLDREEITTAKKPLLVQLCKDYDLDSMGTREELRQRLLSYLDQLEGTTSPEASPEATKRVADEQGSAGVGESESLESASEAETSPHVTRDLAEPRVTQRKPEPSPLSAASLPAMKSNPEAAAHEAVNGLAGLTTAGREPAAVAVPSFPAGRVDHPCPTCGRALTYIPQYNRWYCYSCKAYAPRGKAKFACPNCGASLRWITQYKRWWCDACRRYAPADLPKPERSLGQTATLTQTITARPAAENAFAHRHQSPGGGIGLITFGLLLFLVYEILVDLPIVLSVNTGLVVSADVAFGLRFFAILFVAVGAILGLSAIRDRR
jgi:predicted RNA-binding Zn-ribbon protein involved in translation (DUF1610 family)